MEYVCFLIEMSVFLLHQKRKEIKSRQNKTRTDFSCTFFLLLKGFFMFWFL